MDVENVIDYRIDRTTLDGVDTLILRCPGCDIWQYLDDDQAHGWVLVQCNTPECGFHESEDFWILRHESERQWGAGHHPRRGDWSNRQHTVDVQGHHSALGEGGRA